MEYNINMQKTVKIFMIGMIIIALIGFVRQLLLKPVILEGKIECNTGKIDLDIELFTIIQEYKCSGSSQNLTCYDQTTLLEHIKLGDIENMNCIFDYNSEVSQLVANKLLNS